MSEKPDEADNSSMITDWGRAISRKRVWQPFPGWVLPKYLGKVSYTRDLGLRELAGVSLKEAREEAARWKAIVRSGSDPISEHRPLST